jgi:hypothetical protein
MVAVARHRVMCETPGAVTTGASFHVHRLARVNAKIISSRVLPDGGGHFVGEIRVRI